MSIEFCGLVALLLLFVQWTQALGIHQDSLSPSNCEARLKQMGVEVKFLQDNCKCEDGNCRCCFQGNWPQFNISQDFCMNAEFIAEDFELQMEATLNGNTLGLFRLSGRNPPPLCFPVPFPIPIPLMMCVRVKDIYPMNINMHFCVDMLMKFAGFEFLTVPLNCMLIGVDGVQFVNQRKSNVANNETQVVTLNVQ